MTLTTADLWERFSSQLLSFIQRRVNDPQESEDLLQEIFLRIHTHIDTLRDEQSLSSWIYQVARNAIIDRHRTTRPWVELDETIPAIVEQNGSEPDPAAELAAGLGEMVSSLPEKYRLAVEMSELKGMRQQEVAEKLGLSLSGAKSRIQRGREMLRQELLDCCHFEFDRRGNVMDYYPHQVCCQRCCESEV